MEKVLELINDIRENATQKGASRSDEVKVMRAMLNDRDYKVGIYKKEGLQGTFCPAEEAREMISSVISSTAKIPQAEAQQLANDYDFKKAEAASMVNISKEFVNTYLETERKLPLGGREMSDVSLKKKEVEGTNRTYPKRVGVDESGKAIIEIKETYVNPHNSVKVIAPCPEWLK